MHQFTETDVKLTSLLFLGSLFKYWCCIGYIPAQWVGGQFKEQVTYFCAISHLSSLRILGWMPFRPSDLLMFKFVNRLWTSVVTSLVTFILTQFIKLKFTSGMGIFYTSLAETDIKNLYNFFAIFLSSFIPLSFDSSTTYMRSRTPARHLKIRLLLVAVSSHAAFSLFVYIIACSHFGRICLP